MAAALGYLLLRGPAIGPVGLAVGLVVIVCPITMAVVVWLLLRSTGGLSSRGGAR